VIDVTDPRDPGQLFDTWGSADAVAVAAGHVYVADQSGGLVVVRSAAALAALEQEAPVLADAPGSQPEATRQQAAAPLASWLSYAACQVGESSGSWLGGALLSSWRSDLVRACGAAEAGTSSARAPSLTPAQIHTGATAGVAGGNGERSPGW
jgi:hypothetical protein